VPVYRPRVADLEVHDRMRVMGAVLIEGPKAVGKTATAEQLAATVVRVDVDPLVRAMLETLPSQIFEASTPILFDEWQEAPELWNFVRRAVDDHDEKGLYLLTGSARPRDDARLHSGAGRIARLRMRPMSLFESEHSTGEVSLEAILDGGDPSAASSTLSIPELLERIVAGGWPEARPLDERDARRWMTDYLAVVAEVDVPALGPRRNPGNISRLLTALARATGTPLNRSALEREVGGDGGPIATETLANYLDALDRLMLTEPLAAWRPHMRSRARLRTTPVHHFVDPALGTAALGVGRDDLLRDLEAAGFHFESLALRDLRIYSQHLGARLSSWRDTNSGREVDAILELPGGRWAAFEVKLGEGAIEAGAASLLAFANTVDLERHGAPAALVVLTGGRFTYRRPDGVLVVPLAVLGP
jgi:predicted AAA+ superfamily ATPase